MKAAKIAIFTILITLLAFSSEAMAKRKYASAKYSPVTEYLSIDSTLSQWYKQYMDVTSARANFENFLKILSSSEVLMQKRAQSGVTHNQLYSPIVTLLGKDWADLDALSDEEHASIKISMVELDIALAAIESVMPYSAKEEFRNEVIKGAKPLTQIAEMKPKAKESEETKEVTKIPPSAVEVMTTLTVPEHELSDKLNAPNPALKVPPKKDADVIVQPTGTPRGYYEGF